EFDILIREDFSTDQTRNIVWDYQNKYPDKIRLWLAKENLYSKKIKLNHYAFINSKYIARCEGDDYWIDPLKLQKQIDFLENNLEFSMCFHNARVEYEYGDKKPHLFTQINQTVFTTEDVILKEWFIPTASIIFRKEFLIVEEWRKKAFHGDYALQLSLAG